MQTARPHRSVDILIHGGGGSDGGGEKVEARSRSSRGEEAYVGQVHSVEKACLAGHRCPGHHRREGALCLLGME